MIVALKRRLRVVTAWPRTSARPSWRHPLRRHAASGAAPLRQIRANQICGRGGLLIGNGALLFGSGGPRGQGGAAVPVGVQAPPPRRGSPRRQAPPQPRVQGADVNSGPQRCLRSPRQPSPSSRLSPSLPPALRARGPLLQSCCCPAPSLKYGTLCFHRVVSDFQLVGEPCWALARGCR